MTQHKDNKKKKIVGRIGVLRVVKKNNKNAINKKRYITESDGLYIVNNKTKKKSIITEDDGFYIVPKKIISKYSKDGVLIVAQTKRSWMK